jgi:hypothetical protein
MNKIFFLLLIFVLGCTKTAPGRFYIQEENDWFSSGGKSDNNYTQGLFFNYKNTYENYPKFIKQTSLLIPNFQDKKTDIVHLELGQKIYTPEDLKKEELIERDNPYAGWLFGSIKNISLTEDKRTTTAITLGIIGPESLAEQTQTGFHELCNCDIPKGWGNQLETEPGFIYTHLQEWIDCNWKFAKLYSGLQFRLGNVHTDAQYFEEIKFGPDLPQFNEIPINSYYVFTRLTGITKARDIFYDGNTWRDSHSVDTKRFLAESKSGLVFLYEGWKLGLNYLLRTKDYAEQKQMFHSVGLIELGKDW